MSAYLDALAGSSLQDQFDTAAGASAGVGLGEIADMDTPTTDVVRGAKPADDPSKANNGWAGVWTGLGGALNKVGEIELQRYAQRRLGGDAAATTNSTQAQAQRQASGNRAAAAGGSMLPWMIGGALLLGLVAVVALRK